MSFAALILSHGRPDNVITYRTLRRGGYTGLIRIVIDNEDAQAEEYHRRYPGEVVVFDKAAVSRTFDTADLSQDRRSVVYARNACAGIAAELGVTHYVQLDDDYQYMGHRMMGPQATRTTAPSRRLDEVFAAYVRLLEDTGALTVAMAQGGDYIGGSAAAYPRLKRKAMNSFFARTERPVNFLGRINEDVNTYVTRGNRGELFFTTTAFYLVQRNTQTQGGGMTELYQDGGTYVKSFYPVMMAPSCVSIGEMTTLHRRTHHSINWRRAVPVIISGRYRKD